MLGVDDEASREMVDFISLVMQWETKQTNKKMQTAVNAEFELQQSEICQNRGAGMMWQHQITWICIFQQLQETIHSSLYPLGSD